MQQEFLSCLMKFNFDIAWINIKIPIFSTGEIVYILFMLTEEIIVGRGNSKNALNHKTLTNQLSLFAMSKCYFCALFRDVNVVYNPFLHGRIPL